MWFNGFYGIWWGVYGIPCFFDVIWFFRWFSLCDTVVFPVIWWGLMWYRGYFTWHGGVFIRLDGFFYVIQHFLMWFNVFLMCYFGFSPLCGSAQKKSKLLTTETSNTCICAPFHSSDFFTFKQPRSNSSFPALQMLLSTEESLPSGV